MSQLTREPRARLGATLLALAAIVAVTGFSLSVKTARGNTVSIVLPSVSSSTLAASGFALTAPTASASTSDAQAVKRALSEFPGATVRDSTLALVANPEVPILGDGRLCWVISIVPPGGIWSVSSGVPGHSRLPGSYRLVFVDASTGDFVLSVAGGEVAAAPTDAPR